MNLSRCNHILGKNVKLAFCSELYWRGGKLGRNSWEAIYINIMTIEELIYSHFLSARVHYYILTGLQISKVYSRNIYLGGVSVGFHF